MNVGAFASITLRCVALKNPQLVLRGFLQAVQQHFAAGATSMPKVLPPECLAKGSDHPPNRLRAWRFDQKWMIGGAPPSYCFYKNNHIDKIRVPSHLPLTLIGAALEPTLSEKSYERLIVDDPAIADHHVGQVFVAAADKGFRSLDLFVTWFTAGTAAALGLAAANLPKLEGLISMAAVKAAIPWLGGALLLVLLSKFFGSIICTMAGAAEEGRRLQREALAQGELLPSRDAFLAAARRATPWPLLPFTKPGPLGRVVMRRLMWSGLSALLAATCVVIFWVVLLSPGWSNHGPSSSEDASRNASNHL